MAKFGSLRKLPSGRWQARYTDHNNGRMISAPDTFRTKSDASAWLAARRADIDRGLIANDVAARLPLAAYWDDYLPSIEVRLRPSSVRDYSYSWSKWIKPRFGAVPVSKILPRDIDRWMADMQAKGMSAQKVRSAFGVLSRLLDRAVRDGAIPVNPASRRSDPLPGIRRMDRPVLTVAEVEDLVVLVLEVRDHASRVDDEDRQLDPIAVGFHDLRSVCASLLIDSGASPKDVQAHLGHASIQTTLEIYARVRPERSADLAQRLDALIDEGAKARPRRGESAEKV